MTATAASLEYRCPGEEYAITRSVHLARLAAFYPKCRECPCRHESGSRGEPELEKPANPEAQAPRSPLFTAEGLRGVYLNEVTRQTAAELSGALASLLWEETPRIGYAAAIAGRPLASARPGPAVVIAYDERPASPDIVTGAGIGLRRMGCRVIDIGLATRPCFWFAVDHLQAAAGIHVTGSGCDPAWIGLDFVGRGAVPCSRGGALDRIAATYRGGYGRPSRHPGAQRTFHAHVPYEAGLWKHFHALRPLRIVLACPSRQVRDLIARLFHKLACRLQLVELPTRSRNMADPADPDVARTAAAVCETGAHVGVLVDDDGQRCAFLNETGELVPFRLITALLAEVILSEDPGRTIVLEESGAIELAGGCAVPGGETPGSMAQAMRTHKAVGGGGDSGRFWLQESFPTCDAVLTLARILQALSRTDAPFSEVAECRRT